MKIDNLRVLGVFWGAAMGYWVILSYLLPTAGLTLFQPAAGWNPTELQKKIDQYLGVNKGKPILEPIERIFGQGGITVSPNTSKPEIFIFTKKNLDQSEIDDLKTLIKTRILEPVFGNFQGGLAIPETVKTQLFEGIQIRKLPDNSPVDTAFFLVRLRQYYNDSRNADKRSGLDRLSLKVLSAWIDVSKLELVVPVPRKLSSVENIEAITRLNEIRNSIVGNYEGGLPDQTLRDFVSRLSIRIEFQENVKPEPVTQLGHWQLVALPFYSVETHLSRGGHHKVLVPYDVAVVTYQYSWMWINRGSVNKPRVEGSARLALAGRENGEYPIVPDNYGAAMSALKRGDSDRALNYLDRHLVASTSDVIAWRMRAIALYDLSRESEARETARYSEALARKTGLSMDEQARSLHAIQGARRDFVSSASRDLDDKSIETALANPPKINKVGGALAMEKP